MDREMIIGTAAGGGEGEEGDEETVRTLFVSGLPLDIRGREVYNLFRFSPGFESASISSAGERKLPVAFVVFADQNTALNAREQFNGINFDPDLPVTLRIELAKSNSKTKRRGREASSSRRGRRTSSDDSATAPSTAISGTRHNYGYSSKRFRQNYYSNTNNDRPSYGTGAYLSQQVPLGDSADRSSATEQSSYDSISYQSYGTSYPGADHSYSIAGQSDVSHAARPHAPCSTLFVGNLGPGTSEKELEEKFSSFTGFERLKLSRKDNSLMCFVEFQNMGYSSVALNSLQGVPLDSADHRPMRIEFARNRMGEGLSGTHKGQPSDMDE